ncbi:MAG: ATP-binding protein [Acidimicrobiaceae bacterium]|nr:ATP-binding protein [Acidimicrobiaceae bacterium]
MSSAVATAEVEICLHLARHGGEPAGVKSARAVVAETLAQLPSGLVWVGLDWENSQPRLDAYPLPEGPMPGIPVGAGVTRAHSEKSVFVPQLRAVTPISRVLPVNRTPEGDLDPHPRSADGVNADLPVSIAAVMAEEMAGGRSVEEAAARAGATLAEHLSVRQAPGSNMPAIAEALISAERSLGGDFYLVSSNGVRAEFANRKCPFGQAASPQLCRFTSTLAGGLAARGTGGAEITLDERLALGDPQCRLIVDLGPPSGRLTSHRYEWPPAGFATVDTDEVPVVTPGFRVTLSLQLPRDRLSVPVPRHLVSAVLGEVGVVEADIHDVELALTEACANVINHSGPGDAYEVAVTISASSCHLRVIDVGHGFDHDTLGPQMADLGAEQGRGVALMHALVDQVRFESRPERGTVVHLVKRLDFDDTIPGRQLMLESFGDEP